MTDSERCGITDLGDGELGRLQLEHGSVLASRPTAQRESATIWRRSDLIVTSNCMLGRHDHA
jgi:hypothetical protein